MKGGVNKYPNDTKNCDKEVVSITTWLPIATRCESNGLHDNLYYKHQGEHCADDSKSTRMIVVLPPLQHKININTYNL